jgi:hypothetical protein
MASAFMQLKSTGEAATKWRMLREPFLATEDDTLHRLRYAQEWEAEQAQPAERALLIRLQLRLAEIGRDHPEWFRLRTRIEEILLDHHQALIPGWFPQLGIRNPVFHRGFIEGCVAPMATLLNPAYRNHLFACAPIRHLTITGMHRNDPLDLLFQAPEIRGLISLALDRQGLDDDSIRTLATQAGPSLRWLSIRDNGLSADSLEWLQRLPSLEFVDFAGNGPDSEEQLIDDQGVVLLRRPSVLAERYPFLRGPMPDRYALSEPVRA